MIQNNTNKVTAKTDNLDDLNFREPRAKLPGRLCDVTWYKGKGEIQAATMTPEEVLAMNLEQFHCCRAACLGMEGYLDFKTGEWRTFKKPLGRKISIMLEGLQWEPGAHHDAMMLYEATGNKNLLDNANVASYVRHLRAAFGENKENEYFIITNDAGVAWPRHLSWITIRWLKPADQL